MTMPPASFEGAALLSNRECHHDEFGVVFVDRAALAWKLHVHVDLEPFRGLTRLVALSALLAGRGLLPRSSHISSMRARSSSNVVTSNVLSRRSRS